MKPATNFQRRSIIRTCYAVLDVAILSVIVLIVYTVRLPGFAAVTTAALIAGIVLTIVHRWFLPKPPPLSDEERLQLPKLRPVWLPLGITGIALLYLVTHMRLAIATVLIVVSIGTLVALELRERRKAEERLS